VDQIPALRLSLAVALSLGGCGAKETAARAPATPDPAPTLLAPEIDPAQPPSTPHESKTPTITLNPPHSVGVVARAADYSLSVLRVQECEVKLYFLPKEGNIKLGVELSIENLSDEDLPVNSFYAKVSDSDGTEYASTFGGCKPEFINWRIGSGVKTGGWIMFEIPATVHGLTLTYNPVIIGKRAQPLVFDLGR
jgi:hypothetical protein